LNDLIVKQTKRLKSGLKRLSATASRLVTKHEFVVCVLNDEFDDMVVVVYIEWCALVFHFKEATEETALNVL
jgi:hypothetical protein